MMRLAAAVAALLSLGAAQEGAPDQLGRPIRQINDTAAQSRCMGSLVGFRNVPVACVVGAAGSLEQCELLTENRDVLRLRRQFLCMAGAVRVVHVDDETPAVGRVVHFRLNGTSHRSSNRD